MAVSLLRRSPLPGIYAIPPLATSGTLVFRQLLVPDADIGVAVVQLDRAGAVVGVNRWGTFFGSRFTASAPPGPFDVRGGAEYFACAFTQTGVGITTWPAFSVVWRLSL